jgi:hypothetical protein
MVLQDLLPITSPWKRLATMYFLTTESVDVWSYERLPVNTKPLKGIPLRRASQPNISVLLPWTGFVAVILAQEGELFAEEVVEEDRQAVVAVPLLPDSQEIYQPQIQEANVMVLAEALGLRMSIRSGERSTRLEKLSLRRCCVLRVLLPARPVVGSQKQVQR